MEPSDDRPAYAYVPGGPWPHPNRARGDEPYPSKVEPIPADWRESAAYLRGFRLFDEGFYWESHEVWEALWHSHGRRGPVADALKALIKLAAAGVKVREGQARGVTTHAGRARDLFLRVAGEAGPIVLGLDLPECARIADSVAKDPPADPGPKGSAVHRVFAFRLTETLIEPAARVSRVGPQPPGSAARGEERDGPR